MNGKIIKLRSVALRILAIESNFKNIIIIFIKFLN